MSNLLQRLATQTQQRPGPAPTCLEVGPEVGRIFKLVRKDGVGLLCCAPPRHVDKVVRVCDGHGPQTLHLCPQGLQQRGSWGQLGGLAAEALGGGAGVARACWLYWLATTPILQPSPDLQHLRLLYRRVVRHGDEGAAAVGRGAHRQADARAAHGAFCDQATGRQLPLGQRLLNDLQGHPVLHAPPRVEELGLDQNLRQRAKGQGGLRRRHGFAMANQEAQGGCAQAATSG